MRIAALVLCGVALAGCAVGDRGDCPGWRDGGAAGLEATLDQWARMPAEGQLATAALAARAAFEFADEYAWIAAAASVQECINNVARDRGGDGSLVDGSVPVAVAAAICVLRVEPRRGMRRLPEYELGPKTDP